MLLGLSACSHLISKETSGCGFHLLIHISWKVSYKIVEWLTDGEKKGKNPNTDSNTISMETMLTVQRYT